MDRVVMRLDLLTLFLGHFVEEVADLVSVPWVVDVPEGAGFLLAFFHTLLGQVITAGIFYGFNSGLLIGYSTLHEYDVSRVQGEGQGEKNTQTNTQRLVHHLSPSTSYNS